LSKPRCGLVAVYDPNSTAQIWGNPRSWLDWMFELLVVVVVV
jgi:hypothetical protein